MDEASAVARMDGKVATGGDRSLLSVLIKFRESLDQAIEGVRTGMANYQQVEEEVGQYMNQGLQDKKSK